MVDRRELDELEGTLGGTGDTANEAEDCGIMVDSSIFCFFLRHFVAFPVLNKVKTIISQCKVHFSRLFHKWDNHVKAEYRNPF